MASNTPSRPTTATTRTSSDSGAHKSTTAVKTSGDKSKGTDPNTDNMATTADKTREGPSSQLEANVRDSSASRTTDAKKAKKAKKQAKSTTRVVESIRQAFNAQFGREVVPEGGFADEDMPNYVDPKEGK